MNVSDGYVEPDVSEPEISTFLHQTLQFHSNL